MDYTVDYSIPQEEEEQVCTFAVLDNEIYRNISPFCLRWMKIMIPLSSSPALVEELITTASPTVMGTDYRMIWPSVMTAMTRRRRKMIPWRSKSCHYNVDILSVL